jgi:hypothetical protein
MAEYTKRQRQAIINVNKRRKLQIYQHKPSKTESEPSFSRLWEFQYLSRNKRDDDRVITIVTSTYVISINIPLSWKVDSRTWRGVLNTT